MMRAEVLLGKGNIFMNETAQSVESFFDGYKPLFDNAEAPSIVARVANLPNVQGLEKKMNIIC